ncbi:hypothetical protein BC332_01342 [Capsicum chinense]|nr:hypothetical protein BC332_01342 [Capsicum chinense]
MTDTILSLLLCGFIVHLLTKELNGKKRYHPIGGTIFNQLFNFHRLHHYMTDLAGKYRTYRLISPFKNEIYTSDPANVEYILKTNFDNYGKGWYNYNILKDLLGDGMFAVDGDKWREQRKLSSHDFSTRVLRDFSTAVFKKDVAKLAQILSEAAGANKTVDIQDLFLKASLDSIFRVAFGVELDSMSGSNEEGKKFSDAFDNANAVLIWRYVDILWKIKRALSIGSEAKLRDNIRTIDAFVYKLIHRKTEQMNKPETDLSLPWKKEDILSRLLQITGTDPKYLREIILNFILAGRDTTAITLSWFIYVLCKYPHVQEKIAQEIKETTIEKENATDIMDFAANVSEDAFEKMQYLHAALTETLRLYPAVPVIGVFWASKVQNARHGQALVRVVTNLVSKHSSWSREIASEKNTVMPPCRIVDQNTQSDEVRPTHRMRTRNRAHTPEFVPTPEVPPVPTSLPRAPRTNANRPPTAQGDISNAKFRRSIHMLTQLVTNQAQ